MEVWTAFNVRFDPRGDVLFFVVISRNHCFFLVLPKDAYE